MTAGKVTFVAALAILALAVYIKPAFFGYYGFNRDQCFLMFGDKGTPNAVFHACARVHGD